MFWSKWQHAKCGYWRRGAGILHQSKSVSVTCVLVHVALPPEWGRMTPSKLWTLFPQRNLYVLYPPGLVDTVVPDVRDRRSHAVIIRQCLPCEKQTLSVCWSFSCFSFPWIYSKVNAGVGCQRDSRAFLFFDFNIFTVQHAQSTKQRQIQDQDFDICIYSFTVTALNWWVTAGFKKKKKKSLYFTHMPFFVFRVNSHVMVCMSAMCSSWWCTCGLWCLFLFKVICFSPGGAGCELYIHTAPSWQWPLLAPQLSQSYLRLLFHQYACIIRNVIHVFTSSRWRTQHSYVQWVSDD